MLRKKLPKKKPKTTRNWFVDGVQQWEVANCAPTYRGSMSNPSIEWELCTVLSDMNKRVISWDLEIRVINQNVSMCHVNLSERQSMVTLMMTNLCGCKN